MMSKGLIDGILDVANFARNYIGGNVDRSGLGPRMTKWDGNTMSATESEDAKGNAVMTAGGFLLGEAPSLGAAGERILETGAVNRFNALTREQSTSIWGGGEKSLVRFGQEAETTEFLAMKAQEAEDNGFRHGVSSMLKDKIKGSDLSHKSAIKSTVEKFFKVKQTGNNPRHHTIILPKPVTPDVTQQFNKIFKPKTK
ncbi:hypothetical protein [uncultured Chryseobacterium sp.]|uniref:hypothetical protein n=1 Tax=uncultured Chryseobacterium sp. TaxID=259322 RepID=UPI0025CF5AC3|nr:hypothetical protein [uncultured Chryseobacterium sp.]